MTEEERIRICASVRNAVAKASNGMFPIDLKDLKIGPDEFFYAKDETFCVSISGGRNKSISENAPYYLTQLAFLLNSLKYAGVKAWPIEINFDCPDDQFSATFGLKSY